MRFRRAVPLWVSLAMVGLSVACGGGSSTAPTTVAPGITTQPVSTTVVLGQTATFTAAASGTPAPTLQWSKNGSALSGATQGSYTTPATTKADNGATFTLAAQNSAGSATSQAATLTVTWAPSFTTAPANAAVTAPATATFTAATDASPAATYQWQQADPGSSTFFDISGATQATFTTGATTASQSGTQFRCVGTNSAGTVTSAAATLTVNALPTITTFSVVPGTVAIGAGAILTWDVTGAASISVDQGIGTLTGASGTYNVAPTATTTYTLTATNGTGSATGTATLVVDATPFSFTGLSSSPSQVSYGGSSTLSWTYNGLPMALTLDGAPVPGTSAVVRPVRRETFTLTGQNAMGSDSRSIKVAAQGLDLLAGNPNGPGSIDGTGAAACFRGPRGVAVDSAGNVYVADTFNNTIRKITSSGVVTTLAGTAGVQGHADGTGAAASFYQPNGVAVDSAGNVYVADTYNSTIRKISPAGVVTTLAGTAGVQGHADGTGAAAVFRGPEGVAVDSAGNVYVADTGNNTIRKITPAGVVTTLAGTARVSGDSDGTGAAASFAQPLGVAVDSAGNVYVADTYNNTIRKITSAGVVTTLAGTAGTPGSADGTGAAASFYHPYGGAVDSAGNVYVADTYNSTIRKITPAGVVTTLAGTGAAASFAFPWGVAVDDAGNVYVADTDNRTIRKISPSGVVTTLAGTAGVWGSADGTGAAASFEGPCGVAVDDAGNVYVADTDNNTIRKITPAGVVTTLAGTARTYGHADGTGAAASFDRPYGVAVDSAGNVYVADTGNNTIRKITPAGVVTTLAGTAGTPGSADGTGAAASFTYPYGVAVDDAGNVYVADTGNSTIRKITPSGVVTTIAGGPGQAGYVAGLLPGHLAYPTSVAVTPDGDLVITMANGVVQVTAP